MMNFILKKLFFKKYALYSFFGLFWLPIIVFGSLNIHLIGSLVESDKASYLTRAVGAQGKSVERFLKDNLEQVSTLANTQRIFSFFHSPSGIVLPIRLSDYNFLHKIFVTRVSVHNLEGRALASSSYLDAASVNENKDHFELVLSRRNAQMNLKTQDKIAPEVMFSAPIYSRNNQPIGIFSIHYSLSVLQDVVSSHYDLAGKDSYGLVINGEGEVISATNRFDIGYTKLKVFDPLVDRLLAQMLSSKKNFHLSDTLSLAFEPVGMTRWRSLYIQPANALVGSLHEATNNFIAIMVLVFVLALVSSYITYLLILQVRQRERELKLANDEILTDLRLGSQVQKALQYTPKLPDSIDFTAYQKAAKHVSGDLSFTYFNSSLNIFTSMIIDVNGKGVQAALKAAAFSSIAKSVWTSLESYGPDRNRFAIFRRAAQKFVQNTGFKEDFLAVIGCEYHLNKDELLLYRLNYTAPLLVGPAQGDSVKVRRIEIPNDEILRIEFLKDHSVVLLGDAFIESSRSEKRIIKYIKESLRSADAEVSSSKLCEIVLEIPLENQFVDDQTILVVKNIA